MFEKNSSVEWLYYSGKVVCFYNDIQSHRNIAASCMSDKLGNLNTIKSQISWQEWKDDNVRI